MQDMLNQVTPTAGGFQNAHQAQQNTAMRNNSNDRGGSQTRPLPLPANY